MPKSLRAIYNDLANVSSERSKIARREKALLSREQNLLMELKKYSTSKSSTEK
jgi:hypothetical protein